MTDDQRLEMIDNQLELMESICASFVEGDELDIDVPELPAKVCVNGNWIN